MKKHFQRGLVVGKFSPLHRGHELVINRAFEECDEVILISYSKPELPNCDAEVREKWLAELFPTAERIVVTDEKLRGWKKSENDPVEIPHNDADGMIHRRFCGYLCKNIFGKTVDAVFTSENYGDGFAEELTRYFGHEVRHVIVDLQRNQIPISGTLLRKDFYKNRHWLSSKVYSSFVKRVCLLGGESTGKSTLTETLAKHFDTVFVAEYGRELWENKNGLLNFEDMFQIAKNQVEREEQAAHNANEFLFCDTSPLTTLFYSQHLFGKADSALEQMSGRNYDFAILCAPDFPFVQDGTRQVETFRELQHQWYLRELAVRQIPYLLAAGSIQNRVAQIQKFIQT
jgi:NadR type nicotinamide-nucleotide adenylyltransferase